MKQFWRIIERYYPWLLLLLGVDCFCSIILWISDIQAFQTLIGLVVLTSILLFSAILFVLNKRAVSYTHLMQMDSWNWMVSGRYLTEWRQHNGRNCNKTFDGI